MICVTMNPRPRPNRNTEIPYCTMPWSAMKCVVIKAIVTMIEPMTIHGLTPVFSTILEPRMDGVAAPAMSRMNMKLAL